MRAPPTPMRHTQVFAIGLLVGALGALAIRQSRATSPLPTHTTTRYSLERESVKDLMTGVSASPDETSKWDEAGTLSYSVDSDRVYPQIARWTLILEREAP